MFDVVICTIQVPHPVLKAPFPRISKCSDLCQDYAHCSKPFFTIPNDSWGPLFPWSHSLPCHQ